jgi:hypothetical protein
MRAACKPELAGLERQRRAPIDGTPLADLASLDGVPAANPRIEDHGTILISIRFIDMS